MSLMPTASDGQLQASTCAFVTTSPRRFVTAARLAVVYLLACSLPIVAPALADVPEPPGFWTGPVNSPVPATLSGGKVIHAAELAKLIEEPRPLIIDVSNMPKRPEGMAADAPWLPLPHDAIPGAMWIPNVGDGVISENMDEFFRAQLLEATDEDFDRLIVVYCHELCWLSWNAAKRAIGYGFRNVHWFPEGIEGWRDAGHETEVVRPHLPPEN